MAKEWNLGRVVERLRERRTACTLTLGNVVSDIDKDVKDSMQTLAFVRYYNLVDLAIEEYKAISRSRSATSGIVAAVMILVVIVRVVRVVVHHRYTGIRCSEE